MLLLPWAGSADLFWASSAFLISGQFGWWLHSLTHRPRGWQACWPDSKSLLASFLCPAWALISSRLALTLSHSVHRVPKSNKRREGPMCRPFSCLCLCYVCFCPTGQGKAQGQIQSQYECSKICHLGIRITLSSRQLGESNTRKAFCSPPICRKPGHKIVQKLITDNPRPLSDQKRHQRTLHNELYRLDLSSISFP